MAPQFRKNDLVLFDPDKGPEPRKFVLARVFKNGTAGLVLRQWHASSAANSDVGELVALQDGYPKIPIHCEADGFVIARAVRRFVDTDVDQ